jgi:hypothetical protein
MTIGKREKARRVCRATPKGRENLCGHVYILSIEQEYFAFTVTLISDPLERGVGTTVYTGQAPKLTIKGNLVTPLK